MTRFCFFSPKTATLLLAVCGTFLNFAAAVQLISLRRTLRWEPESEWEGSEKYPLDGLRVVWWLLSAYFSVACVACLVGLIGVAKRNPAYVRLYRDYSVADLCFCALSTIFFALASFRPVVRSVVCEELSRQPDLMRDLAEAGLNLENCESWFERAVVASVALMAVLLVVRLQFTLTISNYHTQLLRSTVNGVRLDIVRRTHKRTSSTSPSGNGYVHGDTATSPSPHRIYLLPNRTDHSLPSHETSGSSHNQSDPHTHSLSHKNDVLVYAPVPLNSLSAEDARELDATEAWVSPMQHHEGWTPVWSSSHHDSHAHHYPRRHHRSSVSRGSAGRISLPIRPGEGLLPGYDTVPITPVEGAREREREGLEKRSS